nr:tRNA 4-thiouridine(8) synthase ThiI [Candidatus Omnitrophota bacterium]
MKAVCSFSGGLDSMLAAKLMLEQGIKVEGLYFRTGFGGCGDSEDATPVRERAEKLGIGFRVVYVGEDLLKIVKDPQHGYGKHMNPCIDCHALFFRKCGEYMKR